MTATATANAIASSNTRNTVHGEKIQTYAIAASSSLLTTREASVSNALLGVPNLSNSERKSMHSNLGDAELAVFRTRVCEQHRTGNCHNADRCPHSHCQTWQRRNPKDYNYSAKLCPEIEFVKKGSKMTLLRRCSRGRACAFAHSKEEELYHPTMYKTKMCNAHPNCTRYFCPFAHCEKEIRCPGVQASPRKKGARGSCTEFLTQDVDSRGYTTVNNQRPNNALTVQRGLRRRATSPGQTRMESPASVSRTQSTHNATIGATWRHEKSGSLQESSLNRLRSAPCPYNVSLSQKQGNSYSLSGNQKNAEFPLNGSSASPFFMPRDTNTRRHTVTGPQREKSLLYTWQPQQSGNYPNSPLSSSSTTAPSSVPSPLVAGLSPLSHHLPLNDVLGHPSATSPALSSSPASSNVARLSGAQRATGTSRMDSFASYSSYLSALEELLKITLHNGSTDRTQGSNISSFSPPLSSLPDIANWNGTESAVVASLHDGVPVNYSMNEPAQKNLQEHELNESNKHETGNGNSELAVTTGEFRASCNFLRPVVEDMSSSQFSRKRDTKDQLRHHSAAVSIKGSSTKANEEPAYSSHYTAIEDASGEMRRDVFGSLTQNPDNHDWFDLLSQSNLNQEETLSFSELERRLLQTATLPGMNEADHNSKNDTLGKVKALEIRRESLPASAHMDKSNFSPMKARLLDERRRASISGSYYLGAKRSQHYADDARHIDQEDRKSHKDFETSYLSLTEAPVKTASVSSLHMATKLRARDVVKEQFSKICHVGPKTIAVQKEEDSCSMQGLFLLHGCSTGKESAPSPNRQEDRIGSDIDDTIPNVASPKDVTLSFGDSVFSDMKSSKALKTVSRPHSANVWSLDEDVGSGQKDLLQSFTGDKMLDVDSPVVSFSDASEQIDSADCRTIDLYSSSDFRRQTPETEQAPCILDNNSRSFSLLDDQPELFQKGDPPISRNKNSSIPLSCQQEIPFEKGIAVQWTPNAEFCVSVRQDETFDGLNDEVQKALGKQDGVGSVGESVSVASTECISRQSCEIGTDGVDILYSRSGTGLWPPRRESQSSYTSAATSGDTFHSDYIGLSSKSTGVSSATPSVFKKEFSTVSVQDGTRMEFQSESDSVRNDGHGFFRGATCESDWTYVHNLLGTHTLSYDQSRDRKRFEEFSSQCASTKSSEGCRSFSGIGIASRTSNSCSSPASEQPTLLSSHAVNFGENSNAKNHYFPNSEELSSLLASARRSREKNGYSRSLDCSTSNPTMSFQGFASPFGFDSLLEALGSGTAQTVLSAIPEYSNCVTKTAVDEKLYGVINAAAQEVALPKAWCASSVGEHGCFVEEPHERGEDENRQIQSKEEPCRLLGRVPPVSESVPTYRGAAETSGFGFSSHGEGQGVANAAARYGNVGLWSAY